MKAPGSGGEIFTRTPGPRASRGSTSCWSPRRRPEGRGVGVPRVRPSPAERLLVSPSGSADARRRAGTVPHRCQDTPPPALGALPGVTPVAPLCPVWPGGAVRSLSARFLGLRKFLRRRARHPCFLPPAWPALDRGVPGAPGASEKRAWRHRLASGLVPGCRVPSALPRTSPAAFQTRLHVPRERASRQRFRVVSYALARVCREHRTRKRKSACSA